MMRWIAVLVLVGLLAAPSVSAASFTLSSPDFRAGGVISLPHEANSAGCHGANVAPRLMWSGPPMATRGFAPGLVNYRVRGSGAMRRAKA